MSSSTFDPKSTWCLNIPDKAVKQISKIIVFALDSIDSIEFDAKYYGFQEDTCLVAGIVSRFSDRDRYSNFTLIYDNGKKGEKNYPAILAELQGQFKLEPDQICFVHAKGYNKAGESPASAKRNLSDHQKSISTCHEAGYHAVSIFDVNNYARCLFGFAGRPDAFSWQYLTTYLSKAPLAIHKNYQERLQAATEVKAKMDANALVKAELAAELKTSQNESKKQQKKPEDRRAELEAFFGPTVFGGKSQKRIRPTHSPVQLEGESPSKRSKYDGFVMGSDIDKMIGEEKDIISPESPTSPSDFRRSARLA